tara:strand:+ start:244 stop:495 length:252 start_codon:yes stop_codon:yes gene_type:complete
MAKNREVSQLGSFITVDDTTGAIGIANSLGVNKTSPSGSYALDVDGVINSNTDIQINGVSVTAGSGGGGASIDDATALAIALG